MVCGVPGLLRYHGSVHLVENIVVNVVEDSLQCVVNCVTSFLLYSDVTIAWYMYGFLSWIALYVLFAKDNFCE